jgi:hypothetical protein
VISNTFLGHMNDLSRQLIKAKNESEFLRAHERGERRAPLKFLFLSTKSSINRLKEPPATTQADSRPTP